MSSSPFPATGDAELMPGTRYEEARLALKGVALPLPTAKAGKKRAAPVKAQAKAKKGKKGEDEDEVDDPTPVAGKEKKVVEVLLAKKFEIGGKISPEGWWMSEKCASSFLPLRVLVLTRKSSGWDSSVLGWTGGAVEQAGEPVLRSRVVHRQCGFSFLSPPTRADNAFRRTPKRPHSRRRALPLSQQL